MEGQVQAAGSCQRVRDAASTVQAKRQRTAAPPWSGSSTVAKKEEVLFPSVTETQTRRRKGLPPVARMRSHKCRLIQQHFQGEDIGEA